MDAEATLRGGGEQVAALAGAQIDLNSLSGPFVIGTSLAMFLQGITLHQGGVFWLGCRRSREPMIYMVTVAVIELLDFVHTVSCVNTIYQWTVRDYGNPSTLILSPWSFMIEPGLAAVTASIVHLFYAHRILLISDGHSTGKFAACAITVFTLVQLAFGCAVSSKIVTYDYEFVRFIAWLWGACVWLGTLAAADILICATYTFYLNRVAREMSGPFVHSTQTVLKVAVVVLATNGCSALVAVIAVVLFGSFSSTNYHAIPQLCLSKMLTLSLFVCLNARTLLSDMIGAAPAFFHSHMKRQPLTLQSHSHHHHHHSQPCHYPPPPPPCDSSSGSGSRVVVVSVDSIEVPRPVALVSTDPKKEAGRLQPRPNTADSSSSASSSRRFWTTSWAK
ncbi:hypothetical protein JCM3766R1_005559 [Sporobolomyces carnicolor]